jgi:hypothetical protein
VVTAAYDGDRVSTVDVSTPASPSVTGSIAGGTTFMNGPNYVATSGTNAFATVYINNRVTVVDFSTPASPTVLGSVQDNTYLDSPEAIYISGTVAYVQAYQCLTAVDISTPASPAVLGSLSDTELDTCFKMDLLSGYLAVCGWFSDTVKLIDISTPASPTVAYSVTDATNLPAVSCCATVAGNLAVTSLTDSRLTMMTLA